MTDGPSEAEFTDQVLALAKLRGWLRLHIRPARTAKGWRTPVQGDGKGFPDLLLLRGDCLLVAELKVKGRRTRPEQDEWLSRFERAGAATFRWTPADWKDIERVLEHGVETHQ